MSTLTPASEVILRHNNKFTHRRVLFAGDLQDELPSQFDATDVRVHTTQYHHWQLLRSSLGDNIQFSLLVDAGFIAQCDTLIYYWPKSKCEALFQLSSLFSLLPVGIDVFIVGENRSGVRSAEVALAEMVALTKIDSARRCGLYHGCLKKQPEFNSDAWWGSYQIGDTTVKTLPSVFSYHALDVGSKLLIASFNKQIRGKVLDIGCGAGVLASVLAKYSPQIALTLSDVNAAAIKASRATLAANQLVGSVVASNIYSDIQGYFDVIISNPPFHECLQTSLHVAQRLIQGAALHLQVGGKLRIVANAFLPYAALLDATFGHHEVLAQTGRFKVYQATMNHQPRHLKSKSKC